MIASGRRSPARAPLRSLLCFGLLFWCAIAAATAPPGRAAIASAHPLATAAGFEILDAGGNAFDAAVAVSAALAVVEPYSSGIGGGGFWLLHRARDGRQVMVDGRERAPLAAHGDLYLDADGELIPGLSVDGALAAAIPGEPAALAHLAEHYGRLPFARTLAPAIALARDGFAIDDHYRRLAAWRLAALRVSAAAAARLLVDGEVPEPGWRIVQPELAATLESLARDGHDGFYAGEVAARLVAGVRAAGGIWSLEDLARYRVVERAPVVGRYRGRTIVSAAPPSSGGVVLVEMLNMLERFEPARLTPVQRIHVAVEAMRHAYRDRAEYLGDPDQVEMPLARLLDPHYAAGLARSIRLDRAGESPPIAPPANSGRDTTHLSILDRDGNRVAATLSINYPFGSGLMPPGTGVLLNNEMDDFSARPGTPNLYGLVGAAANAIAPGRRMLSSMAPTFVEGADEVVILGTPGGSRIISMVLLAVLAIEEGGGPTDWVARPRFHHQYLPDRIEFEPGAFDDTRQAELRALGHTLRALERDYGNMQAIRWNLRDGTVEAASDPRGIGAATVR